MNDDRTFLNLRGFPRFSLPGALTATWRGGRPRFGEAACRSRETDSKASALRLFSSSIDFCGLRRSFA